MSLSSSLRWECPICETSYPFKRSGIPEDQNCRVTTVCNTCYQTIEIKIEHNEIKETWSESLRQFRKPIIKKTTSVKYEVRPDHTRVP